MNMRHLLIIPVLVILSLITYSCKSPKEKALETIAQLEAGDSVFSDDLMKNLKTAYVDFANAYPDDPKTPGFLFEAARRSIYLSQPNEALEYLGNLIKNYPNSPNLEDAMFLSAYTLENNLQDYPKAKAGYEALLAKFPNGELAEDARTSLQNLGKSSEDILNGR